LVAFVSVTQMRVFINYFAYHCDKKVVSSLCATSCAI
jgi:hypothetical protein